MTAVVKELEALADQMAPPLGTKYRYDAENQRLEIYWLSGNVTVHDCEPNIYEKYVKPRIRGED